MTQILRIFRKDVRYLAPFILVVLGLQTALAISQVRAVEIVSERPRIVQFLVTFLLLPFAWIFLVALLVLQEPLAGENSFWLTRPYSRRSLLVAKFLFILVFLNLPLFLSDCFILDTLHLPVNLGHLVLRQLPLLTVIIVPAFAFACGSRNVSQFSLFCVLFLVALFLEGQLFDEPVQAENYELFLILLPFVCAAFLAARWTLVASVFILLPVTLFTTHLLHGQAFLLGPPRVPTKTDTPEISFAGPSMMTWRSGTAYEIRLSVRDVPPDTVLYGVADSGPVHITLEKDLGGYYLHFTGRPPSGSFHALLDTWVLNDKATYTAKLNAEQPFLVSSLGICRASVNPAPFQCWSGPRMLGSARVTAHGSVPVILDGYFWQDSLLWGFTPIASFTLGDSNWTKLPPATAVDFTPLFPMAHFVLPVSGNITLPR